MATAALGYFPRIKPPATSAGWVARSCTGLWSGLHPFRRIDVAERLRKRPLVAGRVLGRVLPLAVLEVSWFGEDARAVSPGALIVGVDVVHSNHHGGGGLAGPGRPAVATDVPDDHCSVADVHLGAVV